MSFFTFTCFVPYQVVNDEVEIKKCNFITDDGKLKCDSVEFSYNETPLTPKKGFLVGSDYQ